jgi:phosphate acetyltransferase
MHTALRPHEAKDRTPAHQSAVHEDDAAVATTLQADRKHVKYERLIAQAKGIPPISTAVIWPCEAHALTGPVDASLEKIIAPVLVGREPRIRSVAAEAGFDLSGCEMPRAKRTPPPRQSASHEMARHKAS